MMTSSSIGRRIESCIKSFNEKDYEAALIHYFPALDKTAKRRRPKDGVGKRIRDFIADELAIITYVATRNIMREITVDGMGFPEAIYKFGRTPIAHEGELDERLHFNETGDLSIGEVWNLPPAFIVGLCIAVIIAPENHREQTQNFYKISLVDTEFAINELWGQRDKIVSLIEQKFGWPVFSQDICRATTNTQRPTAYV